MGIEFLTGEFKRPLDEKGRVSLPNELRKDLPGSVLRLTKSMKQDCLQLMPLDEWEKYARTLAVSLADSLNEFLNDSASPMAEKREQLRYRVVAPSRQVEIDRVGRIAIAPELREFADLEIGKNCFIMGLGTYIEIWNIDRYQKTRDGQAGRGNGISG